MPILLEDILSTLAGGSATVALPGSGQSQPPGLEAVLQYAGLSMHDRRYIDKIRITKMDGFQDADVRDSRENNPADHGETAFDAWYGGRTMTIEGRIEAHNINKLRDMQQAFRYAFSGLKENPLYMLRASSIDYGFDDIRINCRKYDKIQMSEQQTNGSNVYRDFMVTLRASKPWYESVTEHQETITFGVLDNFSSDSLAASLYAYDTGSGLFITNGSLFATIGPTNQIYRSDLGYDPIDSRDTIKFTTSATTSGYTFGHLLRRLSASVALYAEMNVNDTSSNINLYKIDSALSLLATSSSFSISASTSYWFRSYALEDTFAADVWTLDPFGSTSSSITSTSTTLTGGDSNLLGDGTLGKNGLMFSDVPCEVAFDDYRIEPMTLNHQVITITNNGNFNSRPKLRLYGPFCDTVITNEVYLEDETSYRYIQINDAISASTYYEYDVSEGTLQDVNGENKFSQLDILSKDILLPPTTSYISITSASTFSSPRMDIFYRDTWM